MSSADRVALRYVKEVTFGTTPSTPALKQIRYTGESLNYSIENITTSEIRPDRVQTDLVLASAQSAGEINFELSYGSFDDLLEGALCGTWTLDTGDKFNLDNGTTRASYTIQKHIQDMTTPQFHNFTGCVMDGVNLNFEVGQIVTGAFSVSGTGITQSSTQIVGATFPAVSTTTPMNAVTNLQNILINAAGFTGSMSSLSLQIRNNVRPIQAIGSVAPKDLKLGGLEVTGNMEIYFTDATMFGYFINGTAFAVSFDMVDGAGNKYTISLPRVKFETGQVVAGGRNTDVMFSASFRALYDSVSGRVIRIARDPI
jgi:hypothetical protein